MTRIRVGIVGLGANTRLRHVPGLRACEGVEIVGVVNRSPESTRRAAEQFGIARTYERWEQLVADDQLDAVVVGTWPYLHCPITVAALEAGKHVLTEARLARDADEARQMLQASQRHPRLVAQVVPSPLGLASYEVVRQLIDNGFLGTLRELVVLGANDAVADPQAPLHWRQSAEYSGLNMLTLGILHEPLIRWVADPVRVMAQTHIFTPERTDPASGHPARVGTPDLVHVLTELPGGARGIYHLSGVAHHGPGMQLHLYGSAGTIKIRFQPREQVWAGTPDDQQLHEVAVPSDERNGWRVEEEFVGAIRGQEPVRFTDFATGLRYMEFTEAVARSARRGQAVDVGA